MLEKNGLRLGMESKEPLALPIEALGLPSRIITVLMAAGIRTVKDILDLKFEQALRSVPGIGDMSVMDITRELAKQGYKLAKSEMEARKPSITQSYITADELSISLKIPWRGESEGYPSVIFGSDSNADVVDPRFEPFGRFLISQEKGRGFYITKWSSSPYNVENVTYYNDNRHRGFFGVIGNFRLRLKDKSSTIWIKAEVGNDSDELHLTLKY